MKKFLIFTLLGALSLSAFSLRAVGLEISYARYLTAANEPYLELFFALNGASLELNTDEAGQYFGGIEATVTFSQNDVIMAADKFRILSPHYADSNRVSGTFFQQQRFALDPGTYTMKIVLFDIARPEKPLDVAQQIRIFGAAEKATTSDLLFLKSFQPAGASSQYAKSGYEIVPMVSSGHYYFPPEMQELNFYLEVYNVQEAVGSGEPYLIRYFLEDYDNGKSVNKYSSFSKKTAGQVEPLLASFNIEALPSGNYNLVVEALNKEGDVVLEKKVFFYRRNEVAEAPLPVDLASLDFTGSFVDQMGFDSLYIYMHYLQTISSAAEQRYQQQLRSERDLSTMKAYFLSFWQKKNPEKPAEAWRQYLKEVQIANKLYGTRIQEGFLTPRGRIFLQYGRPSLVEQRKFEPGLPPYEMWQYNSIATPYVPRQSNKVFIFAEFDPSTNDYQLIHSTAIGELNNRRWQYDLADGKYGTGGDIDQNRIQGSDFGSRLNNNIILNGGRDYDNIR